jgi:hypothetical protein
MKKSMRILAAMFLVAMIQLVARGQTARTWVGGDAGGATDWSNANNWSPPGVPTSDDPVLIPDGPSNPILAGDASCGSLTLSTGALSLSSFALSVNGPVSLGTSGTSATLNVNAGTLSCAGTITIGATGSKGTLNGNSGNILTGGDFSKAGSGVYDASASTLTLIGASPKISSAFNYFNLTIGISGTLSVNGSLTINGDLSVAAGTLSVVSGGSITGVSSKILSISPSGTLKSTVGTIGVSGFGTYAFDGTVEYAGTTGSGQTIDDTKTYTNLTLSGGASSGLSKTAGGDLTINGNLVISNSATYDDAGFTTNIRGNWTNNGTFTTTGTVNLNGTSNQSVNTTSFYRLVADNSSGVTLTGTIIVSDLLTLRTGVVSTGSKKIIILKSAADAVVVSSGSIYGEIERAIGSGSASTYKFTDDHTRITPDGSQGDVTVSVKSFPNTDAPNDPGPNAIKRYYSITPSGALTGTLRLAYAENEVRDGQDESEFSLWRYGLSWEDMLSSGLNTTDNWVEQVNISTWSNWTISPSGSPLPIQLASCTASVLRGSDVEVQWKTISETNSFGFKIDRKRGDAGLWTNIGFVEGHGTTLAPQSYSYLDRSVSFGKYQYRVRQIDLDGKSETFPEMEVNVGLEPGKSALAQNYPNPFNPSTTIEFIVPQAGWVTLKVYNLLGQEVVTLQDGDVEANKVHTKEFNAGALASGLYYYQLRGAGTILTKRMLLLK